MGTNPTTVIQNECERWGMGVINSMGKRKGRGAKKRIAAMAMGCIIEKTPFNRVSVAAVDIAAANANSVQTGNNSLTHLHREEPLYTLLNGWMRAK